LLSGSYRLIDPRPRQQFPYPYEFIAYENLSAATCEPLENIFPSLAKLVIVQSIFIK
jgi:hypothetical protein